MSTDLRTKPLRIKAPHRATTLEIEWADGHRGILPHEILRGYCPCAGCQGHGGTVRYQPGGNLELLKLEQVGNYALALSWADAHQSGIYSFSYLRTLCQCDACKPGFPPAGSNIIPRDAEATSNA